MAKKQSKGLGDDITNFTEKTGIKKVVKKIFGDDCGCEERAAYLNKLFPHKQQIIDCADFDYLHALLPWNKSGLTRDESSKVLNIYKKYIDHKQEFTTCAPCWKKFVGGLKELHDTYLEALTDADI